jgi:hypothetical protein
MHYITRSQTDFTRPQPASHFVCIDYKQKIAWNLGPVNERPAIQVSGEALKQ